MIKCLLIDDDQDDREIFMMVLHKISSDILCLTANDGAAALTMVREVTDMTPDYIFIDLNMPKVNGLECLKGIRAIDRLNKSKVYMYSTTSEPYMVARCKAAGAIDVLEKPTRTNVLEKTLSRLLGFSTKP